MMFLLDYGYFILRYAYGLESVFFLFVEMIVYAKNSVASLCLTVSKVMAPGLVGLCDNTINISKQSEIDGRNF